MTYHPGLAARQRQVFGHQLQRTYARLHDYWTHRSRGSQATRRDGLAKLQKTLRGGRFWIAEVDDTGTLHLRADRAARAARYHEHGKRLLFTTDRSLSVPEILAAYNRDQKPRGR